jgi:hypothetical protein
MTKCDAASIHHWQLKIRHAHILQTYKIRRGRSREKKKKEGKHNKTRRRAIWAEWRRLVERLLE